jgi:hypothetical protein
MALFENSVDQLIATMQATAALDSIVYHRGVTSVTLLKKAWTGRTPFRIMDRGQSRLIWSEKDFLIPCVDLKIGGVEVIPQVGDWIEVGFANVEGNQKFEFMAPNNEPVWRYSDPQRKIYRIHAKRVA